MIEQRLLELPSPKARTVGRVVFNARVGWRLICEPHVTIKLKRVFARMDQGAQGVHSLSDTQENAFDLRWFLSRYPMEMTEADRALLDLRAQGHVEREGLIHSLLAGLTPARAFDLALPPRPYQALAATVASSSGSLLLADDVGLGKTVSAICLLPDPANRPALVTTLTHLPPQWRAELGRFAPGLSVHILKRGSPYDLTKDRGKRVPFPDVIVGGYSKLRGWAETLAPLVKTVIFDECQELRRRTSDKYRAAQHLVEQAALSFGTSATPIYNYGDEFFSVLDCLRPGCLGTWEEFSREWCTVQNGKTVLKDPEAFGTYLRERGLMLRRTKADVGMEMPDVQRIPVEIEADPSALNQVSDACAELARLILGEGPKARGEAFRAGGEFDALLRQATGIAKAPYVAEFVKMLADSGEPVLLYGWHRAVYDIWMDRLKDLNPVMYTGSESVPKKERAKQEFISGRSRVILMSLRAGAGLDGLQQVCRISVFGELDWSRGVHDQNIGRLDRDGQRGAVLAYFMLADSGSDPVMADVLGVKRGQSDPVLNPGRELVEEMTVDPDHIKRLARAYLEGRHG